MPASWSGLLGLVLPAPGLPLRLRPPAPRALWRGWGAVPPASRSRGPDGHVLSPAGDEAGSASSRKSRRGRHGEGGHRWRPSLKTIYLPGRHLASLSHVPCHLKVTGEVSTFTQDPEPPRHRVGCKCVTVSQAFSGLGPPVTCEQTSCPRFLHEGRGHRPIEDPAQPREPERSPVGPAKGEAKCPLQGQHHQSPLSARATRWAESSPEVGRCTGWGKVTWPGGQTGGDQRARRRAWEPNHKHQSRSVGRESDKMSLRTPPPTSGRAHA